MDNLEYTVNYDIIEEAVKKKDYITVLDKLEPAIITVRCYIKNNLLCKYKEMSPFLLQLNKRIRMEGTDKVTLVKNLYCYKPEEEINSDIYMAIINLVNRYEYQERHFVPYFFYTFPHEYSRIIHESINKEFIPPGLKAYYDNIDANLYDYKDSIEYLIDTNYFDDFVDEDKYYNEQWLFSKEDNIFKDLNSYEKEILLLYYEYNVPDTMIAEIFCQHINTINQTKRRLIKELSEKVKLKPDRKRRPVHYKDLETCLDHVFK